MSFSRELYLKWIDSKNLDSQSIDVKLINHCLLMGINQERAVVGFTIFEPRSLDKEFAERLRKRTASMEQDGLSFRLIVPQHFTEKAQSVVSGISRLELEASNYFSIKWVVDRFVFKSRLKIVNVDDSPVILKILKNLLTEDGFCDVVAQVSDSREAAEVIKRFVPDVVTMDMQMPNKNGLQVTQEVLARQHVPIIIVSSLDLEDGSLAFQALQEGAFDYLQKPKSDDRTDFGAELKAKILAAVMGNSLKTAKSLSTKSHSGRFASTGEFPSGVVWLLGASTGGTQAITQILTSLPTKIPPLLIVQHIPPVFSRAFADSLGQLCPFPIKEAQHGDKVVANQVYIAPGGTQMGIRRAGPDLMISVSDDPPVNRFKPSVDYLFHSAAAAVKGDEHLFVAGILTGMGNDGANGLLELKNVGAITFAQDEASSVVYGMPRVAKEIGAAQSIHSLTSIPQVLVQKSLAKRAS